MTLREQVIVVLSILGIIAAIGFSPPIRKGDGRVCLLCPGKVEP